MADAAAPSAEDKAKYETLKKELIQSLSKKRAVDKQLAQIEFNLYNLEGQYLTETAVHSGGNIIQGFDGYLKNQSVGRRKYEVSESDRMFSKSSLTYSKSLELLGEGDESSTTMDEFIKLQPAPGLTTVIVPPATRGQELSAAQVKKVRDRDYQRRKRASVSRRSTGTISDDENVSVGRRPMKRARLLDDD